MQAKAVFKDKEGVDIGTAEIPTWRILEAGVLRYDGRVFVFRYKVSGDDLYIFQEEDVFDVGELDAI